MITLEATLATGSEALRPELETLTDHKLITACRELVGPARCRPSGVEYQPSSCRPAPRRQYGTCCR